MLFHLGQELITVVNLKRRLVDKRLQSIGVTQSQRHVLLMLHRIGDCSQKSLLSQLDMDPGQATRTLDGLEKNGYVRRRPWELNRRCMFIEMTERCRNELMPVLWAAVASIAQQMFRGFSEDEQQQMQGMLQRIQSNLLQDDREFDDDH